MIYKLFSDLNVFDYLQQRDNQITKELDKLDVTQIEISDVSEKFSEQFKLNSPNFNKKEISSTANIEDQMGRVYQENRMGRNPKDAMFTATYVIPFQGDSRIFELYSPLTKPIFADIIGRELSFKLRVRYVGLDLPEEDKRWVMETAKETVETIENNLKNLQEQFDDFNENLEARINEYLEKKKEDIERNEERNKDINLFI